MRWSVVLLTIVVNLQWSMSSSHHNELDTLINLLDHMTKQEKNNRRNSIEEDVAIAASTPEKRALEWMHRINEESCEKARLSALAFYDYSTNLTEQNADRASKIANEISLWEKGIISEARILYKNSKPEWDPSLLRQLNAMANSHEAPIPKSEQSQKKILDLSNELENLYSSAVVTKDGQDYHMEPEFTNLMKSSRDWNELLWGWEAWRNATGPKMKELYMHSVELKNEGARDNGLEDLGSAWRYANYEMDKELIDMVDELYEEIQPLYAQLHAYVRRKLKAAYPHNDIDLDGPIPAHILGNMWAQEWTNILDLVTPYPEAVSYDVSPEMQRQGYDVEKLFRLSESFFASLGMDNMTETFWEKSMIRKPEDGRDVVCHASASDMMSADCSDFRIKMCTQINQEYLQTVHHEMGHIQYFMQYCHQPFVYRNGANAAFHEAIGDTIALSVMSGTHLKAIGLLNEQETDEQEQSRKKDINLLMRTALEKVAFLPFGYLIDKWRWQVFSGHIQPDEYNGAWWQLRNKYQGIKAPIARPDDGFDAGSKYHVPAHVPYIRYFLSFIGQFQFHQALCSAAGHSGPLHQCDIYESKEAGRLLMSVLRRGSSEPWQDTMQVMTGERAFKADAIKLYFQPLTDWLAEQNQGQKVGW